MRRRELIATLIGAAAWPPRANAQSGQVRRIGLLGLDAVPEMNALKQGLQKLGWIEGRNLQIEDRAHGGEPDRMQAAARELVGLQCEVIVASSTPVVRALVKETHTIPIVFGYVVDPIGSGSSRVFRDREAM
jgi:putative ABC transport system substrate-binding protein